MAVTVEDLAEYCVLSAVPTGAKGVEFARFLAAAKQHVASRTGRADGAVTVTVSSSGGSVLSLPLAFAVSIGTITSPSGQTVTASRVDALAGLVQVPAGEAGVWQVQMTGAGLPADLELAVLEIGRHLYNSQRTSLNTSQAGGVSIPAFSIPNRAKDLMGPYVLPAIA